MIKDKQEKINCPMCGQFVVDVGMTTGSLLASLQEMEEQYGSDVRVLLMDESGGGGQDQRSIHSVQMHVQDGEKVVMLMM